LQEAALPWSGTLEYIHIAPAASYEMEELQEAHLIAGRGIEGDRYFNGTGTYSPKPDVREVTLIEMEALDTRRAPQPSRGQALSRRRYGLEGRPAELSLQISGRAFGPARLSTTL
jgi:hypothetical protein